MRTDRQDPSRSPPIGDETVQDGIPVSRSPRAPREANPHPDDTALTPAPNFPNAPPPPTSSAKGLSSHAEAPHVPRAAIEQPIRDGRETPVAPEPLRPSATGTDNFARATMRAPRPGSGWPFVPLAPLVVVVVGLAVALGIGCVGLDHLSRAGDDRAGARAELLAATLAARLSALPEQRRLEAAQLVARRSAAELLVVTPDAEIVYDVTLGAPDAVALKKMLETGRGVAQIRFGRARYAVQAIGPPTAPPKKDALFVVVIVPEPASARGAPSLVSALVALATLLLGVAAAVAYAMSRDVTRDVDFVTDRVRGMAQVRTEPTGELVPARTMDEVGILTSTFNMLVGRFGKASAAYQQDLSRASAADRERAAFLAAVSHELRSPLNAILGFADILMEEVDGPLSPAAREEVEQIRGSGAHLLALINDILEFSALESGQLKLTRSRVDLLALVNEVVREARGLVGDKPLVVRVEGDPLIARVDGRRVRQIIGNLVNNAIKFTQQGEVVIRLAREGAQAALSVSDTGPGISSQERAVIFEEYKQARSERLRRRGTGLGLAITRRLVMLHHGSIQVESELGRGSTFKVLLPVGNVDAPASLRASARPKAGP
jgi:signal transduction histidine kinase